MPVYQKIAKELEDDLRHKYQAGDYLPSESQLAKYFQVNRHTVRRAIDELVTAGLILRHQGKGNMVLSQPADYYLHSGAHFTGNLLEQGSLPRCEVLQSRTLVASERLAGKLDCEPESKIIHLRTYRKMDGVPRTVIDHYLSDYSWWPVIKHFQSGSLHNFIKKELGVELERKSTRLRAQIPNTEYCRLLQINSSIPLLIIRTTNVIKGTEKVAEYSSSNTRSDVIELVMEH
ncbi:phosphonate metabolism transcriptional regulator PhnF [Photobacterium sp. BZF1]|uniref:Phosphonate metabolism transcriptional regulator PhnF n=1 Tax=Photobacterium rosenbergii TaxID=294936 RepID=A0A2T3NKX1_9GAMM|nr:MULTISPECIES: phosphonate metabolism transcriptional regulator PhnF [Photobacterium]MBC7004782.1 phosphonate metabolism transcriptional regulator PhnF [Photobacterium sp. BZF1]MBY5947707.1 phosphonate metabolism transcriptional regulator PhnF [Photobacterium rosenbergii]PSW16164.1 phosphonate metabolism transcriptional regulator PhnF [Photobacterium rosenbergii]